jgi:predicted AAA+ superfamily ATPase
VTTRQRIDDALGELRVGLNQFVAQQMTLVYKSGWIEQARATLRGDSFSSDSRGQPIFDVSAVCSIMLGHWQPVFGQVLGKREQTLLHEVRSIRNAHMHQEEFDLERTLGALIAVEALLNAVGAGPQAERVRALKEMTGSERFAAAQTKPAKATSRQEPLSQESRQTGFLAVDVADRALIPWRDIMSPHPDVVSRRFVNAEFAADLYQVAQGTAGEEYGDPEAFFARTYLTSGLRALIETGAKRFTGAGGDPVIELQTSFGGGKTHALLALYHLCSGVEPEKLLGIKELFTSIGVGQLPSIHTAVVVGTKLSAGQPVEKPDGTIVRTLWGEIAYQLGKAEAYALVAGSDETGTSPGAALDELLRRYAPCLILIDEWVAYARQLGDETVLCGGTFETQFTFAQALTEAVSATPGAMLVVSLPVTEDQREGSEIEVGGTRGRAALDRLRNVIARKQANWQPADAGESYAIVRRRLFEPLDAEHERRRDAVVSKLHRFYRDKSTSFPQHASEAPYLERLRECYPIHPELFEKLYNEWGAIEQFQRTRGVLRLMAAVVHVFWASGDTLPLIVPGLLPLEDATIVGDLVRYLGEPWRSVLNRDVVGQNSVAARIDERHPNLGRAKAAQRAARTIFFATAPQNAEHRLGAPTLGIDARTIRLGSAFPGDQLATFDDATRRLTDDATHVNTDGTRFWFAVTPNLNRRAQELANQFERYELHDEIAKLLVGWQRDRGAFSRVHLAKRSSAEIPDEPETRLALLGPELTNVGRRTETAAKRFALDAVNHIGEGNRRYRNAIIFLAPDETRLETLEGSVRQALAWRRILEERERFELTQTQIRTAEQKLRDGNDDVVRGLRACWCHALIPSQTAEPGAPIELTELRVEGGDSAIAAVAARLERDGLLASTLGGINLRHELDSKNLWVDAAHIRIATLYEYFAQYPWLRRLRSIETLRAGIAAGISLLTWSTETFAYAESLDGTGRYLGLRAGNETPSSDIDVATGIVVRGDVASKQRDADASHIDGGPGVTSENTLATNGVSAKTGKSVGAESGNATSEPQAARSVFLSVKVEDPTLLTRVASQIATDIIAHLHAVRGSRVDVTIDINGDFSEGLGPDVVDRIRRNAAAHGFPDVETTT